MSLPLFAAAFCPTGLQQIQIEGSTASSYVVASHVMNSTMPLTPGRYFALRREAENGVAAFKLELNNYKPEDIQRVRAGYEKTADRFNQELENMKNDFLNKKKLKYIVEFPKDYARSLELNFKDLSDFYAQNFQQVLQDVNRYVRTFLDELGQVLADDLAGKVLVQQIIKLDVGHV